MTNTECIDPKTVETFFKSRPGKIQLYRFYQLLPDSTKKIFFSYLQDTEIEDLQADKHEHISEEETSDVYLEDELIVAKEHILDKSISDLQSTHDMDSFLRIFNENDYNKTIIPNCSKRKDDGKIVQVIKVPEKTINNANDICLEFILTLKSNENR
eukprot:GAHX01001843.1.p1 GENE.GAHX01001843.1~~GAHX01001843.1.p1  ORF type:complete len:156 (-),score=29.54 GAHX01001843.1:62-529(-)